MTPARAFCLTSSYGCQALCHSHQPIWSATTSMSRGSAFSEVSLQDRKGEDDENSEGFEQIRSCRANLPPTPVCPWIGIPHGSWKHHVLYQDDSRIATLSSNAARHIKGLLRVPETQQ
ncbi:hypothetical protein PYCCODRAFT_416579 [Trametes coccinea BRFM310]|uniref:Uncharacterized protein n=1 Tax=Trametes coccinea (strain BRFM310) TaxID=1353009 RepID=A0A1Y2INJ2_TRAC3|nr:hypothetical protein PYCCODRAFT_416579 [Trametes coccinea BRFM310]